MSKYTRIQEVGGNECVVDEYGHVVRKVTLYVGNSTRPRPTKADGAKDGDKLWERDTGFIGSFDEDTGEWVEA